MITALRSASLVAAALLALGLSACAATTAPAPTPTVTDAVADGGCSGDEGVSVVIDAGDLAGAADTNVSSCIFTTEALAAADALDILGVETEGTEQYGDQVICRVDGQPSASEPVGSTEDPAYVESCATMPAAFAYWSLWVKPAGGTWDYAQEGLSTLQLQPGDSVELLFTLDGAPAAPSE